MDPRWDELQKTGWKYGASIHAKTPSLHTPLMWAAARAPHLIEWLLDLGAHVHEVEMSGRTPFHAAASWPNYQGMQILLDHGANPDFREGIWANIRTPLMDAVSQKKLDVMTFLQSQGVNLTLTTHQGKNALMMAFELGFEEGVNFLLSKQFDLSQRDEMGRNIFLYASQKLPHLLPKLHLIGFDWTEVDNQGRGIFYYGAAHQELIQSYISQSDKLHLNQTLPGTFDIPSSHKPRI